MDKDMRCCLGPDEEADVVYVPFGFPGATMVSDSQQIFRRVMLFRSRAKAEEALQLLREYAEGREIDISCVGGWDFSCIGERIRNNEMLIGYPGRYAWRID